MELSEIHKQMSQLSHLPSLASDIRNKTLVPEPKPVDKSSYGNTGEGTGNFNSFDEKRDRSLHIRNYPDNVTESDVQSLFFPYGKVRSVRLFRDKRFGFVEFTEPSVVDYILREKLNSFSMQGVKLEINGCGRKMMRWGMGMPKPVEPVSESIPSQDVDNLQPDENGFYTISFTNENHFSTFEEAVSAFMRYGLVKDYNNLSGGKTYVRYLVKESAIKAWKGLKPKLKDLCFPLARQYTLPPKPDVVQKLNSIARNMGFLLDVEDTQKQDTQRKMEEIIPGLQLKATSQASTAGTVPELQHTVQHAVPPGVMVTGPPPVSIPLTTGLPQANMQNATVRMLTAGVPFNPGVMATLQRQAAAAGGPPVIIPPPAGMVLGQPGFQQLQQAGLFRQPPPGYLPAAIPGLASPTGIRQMAPPGMVAPGMIFGQPGMPTSIAQLQTSPPQALVAAQQRQEETPDISNIASSVVASVQPQLEALQKAMAQKGIDPMQMAQLTQAMNTLQSFIASSNQQAASIESAGGNKAEMPPWLNATGDIDERKSKEFRSPYQNTAVSNVSTVPAANQAQASQLERQAPWMAKSQEPVAPSVTVTNANLSGLPPWARQPQQQTTQQTGFTSQDRITAASNQKAATVQPPWARSQQQEQTPQVLFQSKSSQSIGSPPWSKSLGKAAQESGKSAEAPWKTATATRSEAPWKTASSNQAPSNHSEAPWKTASSNQASSNRSEAPWKTASSNQAPSNRSEAPWKAASSNQTQSQKRAEIGVAPPWTTSQGKAQATVPPWGKSKSDAKLETRIAASTAPWARNKAGGADKSPPKTPWEAKRQSELASKVGGSLTKKAKYDPFEHEHKSGKKPEDDVIDKRLAEINKKMAAMDRKIKEYEEKEHRRKGGRDRSRSRSRERDRRRRSRSRERDRRDRSWERDRDEGRYRERSRRDRSKSPRSSRSAATWRDYPEAKVPDESRFGRWAKEEEKKDLTDADIVEKLKKATGLTNDLLVHSVMLKMKSVPPAAIYALSECDGKVIQQLTLTGGAMVVPIMPLLQTLHQALGLARTQESYYIAAKIVGVFKEILTLRGKEFPTSRPKGNIAGSRWN